MKLLLIYGTKKGHTAKIAARIERTIAGQGDAVDVVDGRSVPAGLALARYDALIIGASVIAGRFQPYIVDFIKTHWDEVRHMPSAFFGVSLSEADPDPKARARAMDAITRFLEETGWQPDKVASFAGSIAYLRYRWLMRLIWRRLPLPGGRGVGRSRDTDKTDAYDYTDWDAVARFAAEFVAEAHSIQPSAVPA